MIISKLQCHKIERVTAGLCVDMVFHYLFEEKRYIEETRGKEIALKWLDEAINFYEYHKEKRSLGEIDKRKYL